MFDALGEKLQKTFRNLRGRGKLSESNISQAMREIRLALLEADVNFRVARDFVATSQVHRTRGLKQHHPGPTGRQDRARRADCPDEW
jgi:signal recognition particle GTPase